MSYLRLCYLPERFSALCGLLRGCNKCFPEFVQNRSVSLRVPASPSASPAGELSRFLHPIRIRLCLIVRFISEHGISVVQHTLHIQQFCRKKNNTRWLYGQSTCYICTSVHIFVAIYFCPPVIQQAETSSECDCRTCSADQGRSPVRLRPDLHLALINVELISRRGTGR